MSPNNENSSLTSSKDDDNYILSILSTKPNALQVPLIRKVESWLEKQAIKLSTRKRTPTMAIADLKIPLEAVPSLLTSLKSKQPEWLQDFGCDVNICSDKLQRIFASGQGANCMFVFDLDSTLIQMECIDELARLAGVSEEVSRITSDAMNGKYDFCQSLKMRLSLLKGAPVDNCWEKLMDTLPFTKGVFALAKCLGDHGVRTVIVSGGFLPIAEYVREKLVFDKCHANTLAVSDGKLTGCLIGDCIDGEAKRKFLQDYAQQWNIKESCILAIGDGANDALMLKAAAPYGCAFNAKPVLSKQADIVLNLEDISLVLDILGIDH